MGMGGEPVIGDWYMATGGETFEVVAYDPDDQSVEIQYFDGAVEELDLDSWHEIHATPIEPPEDWSGSMDVSREDSGLDDILSAHSPNSPLDDPEL